jgi:solute carrier family 25 carnitine/acylcarnitine transporter 20/29
MDIFLSGASTGIVQTIIGHPFDTLKTRIQSNQLSYNNLYKGSLPTFLGNSLQNSILFFTHHYFYEKTSHHFLSGTISGTLCAFLISPMELWKIRLQNQNKDLWILKQDLTKGLAYTVMRDSFGIGIYFSCYHFLMDKKINCFISGGIAGVCSWIYSYPFDVFKTQVQNNQKVVYKNFYRGFGYVFLRSFLVNSFVFACFEKCKNN